MTHLAFSNDETWALSKALSDAVGELQQGRVLEGLAGFASAGSDPQ